MTMMLTIMVVPKKNARAHRARPNAKRHLATTFTKTSTHTHIYTEKHVRKVGATIQHLFNNRLVFCPCGGAPWPPEAGSTAHGPNSPGPPPPSQGEATISSGAPHCSLHKEQGRTPKITSLFTKRGARAASLLATRPG